MTTKLAEYTETTASAAARFGVTPGTIARWAKKGAIPSIVTPGKWRLFRPADLDEFERRVLNREDVA